MLAVVGARNASSLGTRMARALASGLGEAGQVVVSGLARGVDAVAHQAALRTGTVAVLAGGVDVVYPAENASLAQEIAEAGLKLSEQPLGLVPQARHFPRRNRIVSGLCRAVIVVEAAAKSGSLTTARFALDQGREVMAVPGHPFDSRASGCNMLIRDGAMLVRSAQDVVQALDHVGGPAAHPLTEPAEEPRTLADMSALHRQILDRLGPSPLAEDQLIRDLQIPAGEVGPELLNLELEGRIERRAGGLLSLRIN
jgi:DNA processing protein